MRKSDISSLLIVDDNLQLLKMLELTFLRQGYRAFTASSGDQAIERLQNSANTDILLTDGIMPGHHQGIDVAVVFKNLWPERPVVMMSGYVDWHDFSAHQQAAIDKFVQKPFQLPEIVKVVRTVESLYGAEPSTKRAVGF